MKKSLVVLLSLLMIFTLVGCDSKQEESIKIEEPIKQEQVIKEEVKEEVKEETKTEQPEEVKEEKKVISNNIDITNMYFWVVTFDQYGNEVDRYTAKYGSTVYDPSNGKAVIVKGNTKFYVTYDYTPSSSSSDSGSSEPTPPEVCEHLGEDLYYIAVRLKVVVAALGIDSSAFMLYKYIYNNDENKYVFVFNDVLLASNDEELVNFLNGDPAADEPQIELIPNVYNLGDALHKDSSGNYTKCNFQADGTEFYTLTIVTDDHCSTNVQGNIFLPKDDNFPLTYLCTSTSTDDGNRYIEIAGLTEDPISFDIIPDSSYGISNWKDGADNNIDAGVEIPITSDLTIKAISELLPD